MSQTNKPRRLDIPKSADGAGEDSTLKHGPVGVDDMDDVESVSGLGNSGVMRRLLDDDSLALADDDPEKEKQKAWHAPNAASRRAGFDPYGGAMDPPEHRKKRTDLRALSAWIEKKRKMEQGGDE